MTNISLHTLGASADDSYTGRRAVRVEIRPATPTVDVAPERFSAPESLTSLRGVVVRLGQPRAGGSVAPEGSSKAGRQRVGKHQLHNLKGQLSARDWAILNSLNQHRFLTTSHLYTLHFYSHTSPSSGARVCRRVLKRLADANVIEHLQRRIGGIRAGSNSYVWRVGGVGDRLLQIATGDGVRERRKEPSARWLDHCLAVADLHLALVIAIRNEQLELLSIETEPTCWRDYLAGSGSRLTLKPDLYVATVPLVDGKASEFEDHAYIEVDRATESLPTLIHKCRQYETYRKTGQAQHALGVFPLVIWAVPDDTRAQKLRAAIRASSLDNELFRITTADGFVPMVLGGVI